MNTKFNTIINSKRPVLIDFHKPDCRSCQILDSALEQVKDCLGRRILIIKIDTGRNTKLAQRLNISSLPTVLLFREGKQLWRQSGVQSTEGIISKIIMKNN